MLFVRSDWFSHPDEQAAFEAAFGRPMTVPETWADLRDAAGFFARAAGETLDRDVCGWADALGAGAGITLYRKTGRHEA